MRLKENQTRHDKMVWDLGNDAGRKGWRVVFVDISNYKKPPVIQGYIPDIYAHDGVNELVVEVETADTNLLHGIGQHAAFKKWATERPQTRSFLTFMA